MQLRLGSIWMALPALLVMFTTWTMTDFPLDYWLHVVNGRWIAEHNALLERDVFTHTIAGREVLNFPWLAQWGMYQLHALGGYAGAQFVAGLTYGAAIALITWTAFRRCGDARVAAVLGCASALVAATSLAVRPQAVSVLLFAIALTVLFLWRPGWKPLLVLLGVELIWTNTHGGFPLGVALPGAFLTARLVELKWYKGAGLSELTRDLETRWLFATVAACMLAMFANPHGMETANYVFGVSSTASARLIGEWQPTSWTMLTGKALVLALCIGFIAALGSRRRMQVVEVLLLAPLLIVAFKSQRMAVWWALAAAPVLAPHLRSVARRWLPRPQKDEPSLLNALAASAIVVFLAGSTPFTRAGNPLLPAAKRGAIHGGPFAAMAFLEQGQLEKRRVFHPLEWGCYVSWRLHPHSTVFVDTRIEAYPDDVWRDYLQAAFRGDLDVLDRYAVDTVVWDVRRGSALMSRLRESEHWRESYRDDTSVVFTRCEAARS